MCYFHLVRWLEGLSSVLKSSTAFSVVAWRVAWIYSECCRTSLRTALVIVIKSVELSVLHFILLVHKVRHIKMLLLKVARVRVMRFLVFLPVTVFMKIFLFKMVIVLSVFVVIWASFWNFFANGKIKKAASTVFPFRCRIGKVAKAR